LDKPLLDPLLKRKSGAARAELVQGREALPCREREIDREEEAGDVWPPGAPDKVSDECGKPDEEERS
jgi:hypothetical protein